MIRSYPILLLAFVLTVVWSTGCTERDEGKPDITAVVYVSSGEAQFAEMVPGVFWTILWGDPEKGAYGTFTRFEKGFDAGEHIHSNELWLVVIEGTYLYRDADGEKRVGPGEYIRIPAGLMHWSGGDPDVETLFYQASFGSFDLIPVE